MKHANDVSDHSAEREKANAENQEHLHKARATSRATVIMGGLNREQEDETRLRTSVIREASAKGRSRAPVPPHYRGYVGKQQKAKRAAGQRRRSAEEEQRIKTMTHDQRRLDAVRDERMKADVGARAVIAKAEENLRINKKKKKKRKKNKSQSHKYQYPEHLAARVGK